MKKILALTAILFILSASNVIAQDDFCVADFDYSGGVDAGDVGPFLAEWNHRTIYSNPCPPDGPAPVPKTGQTICYDEEGTPRSCEGTGEDGEYQKGVAWPNPRFTDNGDGTVTDNLTGLIWQKDANCMSTHYPGFDNDNTAGDGMVRWQHALDFVERINDGTYPLCGAGNTDWRLPNRRELFIVWFMMNTSTPLCPILQVQDKGRRATRLQTKSRPSTGRLLLSLTFRTTSGS